MGIPNERLAASYVNFYIANDAVLCRDFANPNCNDALNYSYKNQIIKQKIYLQIFFRQEKLYKYIQETFLLEEVTFTVLHNRFQCFNNTEI